MENYGYSLEDLIPIVAELSSKYTGYDHIHQKAQMLMEAVLYCIGTHKNESNNALIIQNISARDAYINGRRIVIDKAKKLQSIYNKLIINFQDYGNECLKDTITKEIPEFLLRYDFKYAPQETMISLDYPILKDLGTMTGVNVVLEYVECICLEQQFLSNFESRYVIGSCIS